MILGAKSLDDVISRLDTANRLSSEDAQVLGAVRTFRGVVEREGAALRKARAAQSRLVAQRAAAKRQIEDGIAERQRLLSSIRSEIDKLKREEAARQAVLAAQARARLLSERIAQQRALNSVAVGATVRESVRRIREGQFTFLGEVWPAVAPEFDKSPRISPFGSTE